MRKLQFHNATFNLLTKVSRGKNQAFFNFLIRQKVQTYTGDSPWQMKLIDTSSTWLGDLVWKWLLVSKLHISHVKKKMMFIVSSSLFVKVYQLSTSYHIWKIRTGVYSHLQPCSFHFVKIWSVFCLYLNNGLQFFE